jgi:hypothetical protein
MTPTIDADSPPMRIARDRIDGSPPNRLCHSRWLMMATRGPFGASSSPVNPRPSAGFMPITGKRSSSSRPVKTRSGTSPPEMLRFPRSNAAVFAKVRFARMSAYSGGDNTSTKLVSDDSFGKLTPIETSRSGSGYGNGCKTNPSTSPKIRLLPPIASASDRMATAVKPGLRTNWRSAYRMS